MQQIIEFLLLRRCLIQFADHELFRVPTCPFYIMPDRSWGGLSSGGLWLYLRIRTLWHLIQFTFLSWQISLLMGCWITALLCTLPHLPGLLIKVTGMYLILFISMMKLLLPRYIGHKMFSTSGLHKYKQLYYTEGSPNCSRVDMRCQHI